MIGLKIWLWIAGVLFLLAGVGLFLPAQMWVDIVEFFGVDAMSLTGSSIAEYMLRASLAMCFLIGSFLVVLAIRTEKYLALIPFAGLALVFLGVVCGIAGILAGMPVGWILGDSLSCLILGVMILFVMARGR